MEEQDITTMNFEPVASTLCDHIWARSQDDPNSDMESWQCTKCPAGQNRSK